VGVNIERVDGDGNPRIHHGHGGVDVVPGEGVKEGPHGLRGRPGKH
jgi:hypothetical protein